jgi:hypothetical protein
MMNRLFKEGLVTTILGLVIIASSVIGWMFFNEPATDAVVISGIGTGLLFLKDETIGLKK